MHQHPRPCPYWPYIRGEIPDRAGTLEVWRGTENLVTSGQLFALYEGQLQGKNQSIRRYISRRNNFFLQFSNLCGTVYRQGNIIFTSDGNAVLSPVGNRVSVFDLVA